MPIIIAILVFCVIILLHELGHFIAAKLCGIYVKEFAFGMGPVILRKKGKETEYVIRAFPIGGSCSFEGENGGYAEGVQPQARMAAYDSYSGRSAYEPDIGLYSRYYLAFER